VRAETPDHDAREATYDPQGNVVETRDRTSVVRFAYTGFNWLASREEGDGTRADTVHFAYDAEGELIEIRNEKNQPYRFAYDHCRRLVREIGFDARPIEYKRDALGRVVRTTRPIGHTELAYDPRGRIVEEMHADGTWARFAYRGDGVLMRAENPSATVVFERDRAGRIIREQQGDDWIASKYAVTGERIELGTSRDGQMTTIRDAVGRPAKIVLGRVAELRQVEIGFEHDGAGQESRRVLPGGVTATWERDVVGRPRVHAVTSAATADGAWSHTYSWGLGDRLSALTDSRHGETAFQHDHRGRLYSAKYPDGTVQYRAPDEVGNLYRTPDRSDRRYLRGGMPRRAGDTVYEFDANGNLSAKGDAPDRLWRYAWDGAGMLTEVARPDGTKVALAYDALGRRVQQEGRRRRDAVDLGRACSGSRTANGRGGGHLVLRARSFAPLARFTDDTPARGGERPPGHADGAF
jgi:YD repeat-containing protein